MPIIKISDVPSRDVIELHKGEILRNEIFDEDVTIVFLDKDRVWVDSCMFNGDLKVVGKYEGEPVIQRPFTMPTVANSWIKGKIVHEGKSVFLYNLFVGLGNANIVEWDILKRRRR